MRMNNPEEGKEEEKAINGGDWLSGWQAAEGSFEEAKLWQTVGRLEGVCGFLPEEDSSDFCDIFVFFSVLLKVTLSKRN